MSLIINMLKDLDQRHNNGIPTPALMSSQRYTTSTPHNIYKYLFLTLSIFICIGSITYLFLHRKPQQPITLSLPSEQPIQKSAATESTPENSAVTPVSISGISFETKREATDITFLLSHETLYRLVSDEKNHAINLYIDNASMKSDLPTLVGSEVAIQNLTATTINGSMKFTIVLKPGTSLRSADLTKQNENSELVISFNNAQLPMDEPVKVSSGIKSPAIQTVIIEQYQNAIKLSEAGDKQGAMASLSKLLSYYPDYDDARVALAALTLETGDSLESRKIIDDGLAMSPDYLPLIELKARLLTSEGKIKEALMVLQSEQPPIAESPSYHALIAALYNRQDNFNLAAEIYQKLVRINPHEGSWWFGLGVSLDKLGRNQDAVYAYTKAATEGRLNAPARSFLQTRLQTLQDATHA